MKILMILSKLLLGEKNKSGFLIFLKVIKRLEPTRMSFLQKQKSKLLLILIYYLRFLLDHFTEKEFTFKKIQSPQRKEEEDIDMSPSFHLK